MPQFIAAELRRASPCFSDFFTSYVHLLKDKRLSDDEHDARCDLLSYMQTKIETYNWKVVRQFHDQVLK